MTTKVTLGYGRLCVSVESENSRHLEWLIEFLGPQFELRSDARASCRVVLTCNGRLHARLAAHAFTGDTVPAFVNDSTLVELPLLSRSEELTASDQVHDVFYSVRRAAREIEIVAPDRKAVGREPLMKVVRELAMLSIRSEPALMLHAAACTFGDAGIIIAGEKRAGKTSLLSYALMAAGARYVSNDRVVVRFEDAEPQLHGMPTIVALRSSLFELLPILRERLIPSGFQSKRTLAEAAANLPTPQPAPDGRYGLTPAQYCSLTGAESVSRCSAAAVLFPKIDASPGPLRLVPIDATAGGHRLAEAIFGANHKVVSPMLFDLESTPSPETNELTKRCADLSRQVPCYEAQLGPHSYDDCESARVLSRAIETGA